MTRPLISEAAIAARMAENPGLGGVQARNELLAERHMQRLAQRHRYSSRSFV